MSSNMQNEAGTGSSPKKEDMTTAVLEHTGTIETTSNKTVARLVEQCQAGNREAFKRLFEMHVDGVHRHLCLLIGPGEDVDDLVQLVFLNVFQSIRKFRGNSAFSTWLFRITINVARQEIRTKSRSRRLNNAVLEVGKISGDACANTPEKKLGDMEEVYKLMDKISSKKRETFILYTWEGYSLVEIAELLGSTVSTIGSRLQAARKELLYLLRKN